MSGIIERCYRVVVLLILGKVVQRSWCDIKRTSFHNKFENVAMAQVPRVSRDGPARKRDELLCSLWDRYSSATAHPHTNQLNMVSVYRDSELNYKLASTWMSSWELPLFGQDRRKFIVGKRISTIIGKAYPKH